MKWQKKISKSQQVIKEATKKYGKNRMAVAWTGGKDSTVLLHLIKGVFGKVPFPVMFNDSTMEFAEVYEFIDRIRQKWKLDLVRVKHLKKELAEFDKASSLAKKKELVRMMKISAIDWATKKHGFKAYMSAIRWDEHQARSKEKYFSSRKDHDRVHPILHLTEKDVWRYIKEKKVPYLSLYKQGYRSLGEAPFTQPAKEGAGERSGRDDDKELVMKRLRNLGYW